MAQQMQASMMAHINEHLGFEYRKQIELQLGFNLPPQKDESGEDVPMNPEVEAKLAPLLAQAAQRLLQKNSNEMAQQQAQQQMQDPLIQMQMQELQIKQAEQQRKAQKDQLDAQLKTQQQQIERQRIEEQAQIERERMDLDKLKTAAEMRDSREKEIMRMSVDAVKQLSSQHSQKELQRNQPKPPTKGNK
jgi:hypothetical protein